MGWTINVFSVFGGTLSETLIEQKEGSGEERRGERGEGEEGRKGKREELKWNEGGKMDPTSLWSSFIVLCCAMMLKKGNVVHYTPVLVS